MNIIYYLIVFFEGFTTLAVEIIAIRKSMSLVGSNSIITSIILGVILVALSYGYYIGGKIASNYPKEKIIKRLFINLFFAGIFYTFFSFPFENYVIAIFLDFGIGYSASIFIGTVILFFLPVFLASQTIPLINELIDNSKNSETVGKLLFFSTIGSFIGSISSSIIFFPMIGVFKTTIINGLILSILSLIVLLINKKIFKDYMKIINIIVIVIYLGFILSDDIKYNNTIYSFSTPHNDIKIINYDRDKRLMELNGGYSSGININTKESSFNYINETISLIESTKPKKILVIGGAGFTLPHNVSKYDHIEQIDVCDIDKKLYEVSEKYFLETKLSEKIKFFPIPARYFTNQKLKNLEKYDFIFVDAYNGKTIPSQLLTQEFYKSLEKISNGTIVFNFIFDQEKKSDFFKKNINTLISSFNKIYIKNVSTHSLKTGNFLISNKIFKGFYEANLYNNLGIYTDNKGSQEIDKHKLFSK